MPNCSDLYAGNTKASAVRLEISPHRVFFVGMKIHICSLRFETDRDLDEIPQQAIRFDSLNTGSPSGGAEHEPLHDK